MTLDKQRGSRLKAHPIPREFHGSTTIFLSIITKKSRISCESPIFYTIIYLVLFQWRLFMMHSSFFNPIIKLRWYRRDDIVYLSYFNISPTMYNSGMWVHWSVLHEPHRMDFYRRELCAAKNIYGRNSNSKPSDSDTMMEGPYLPVQL
jgi:hypothetical protein